MKEKLILGSVGLFIMLIISCEKTENSGPQISDAVKEYYGLVVEATQVSQEGKGNVITKNTEESSCMLDTITNLGDTSVYISFTWLPCSGMEGFFRGIYYMDNNNHKQHYEVCFLDESIIGKIGCHSETTEEDYLSVGVKFHKSELKFVEEGKPDFEHKVDAIFSVHPVITSQYYDEVEDATSNAKYTGLRGIETDCSEMYKKDNIYNSINMVPVEYLYDTEWRIYEDVYSRTVICDLRQYKVKGIVKVEYERDGKQGEFTIDYGNGEKDYKAIITEDGISYEINYKELLDSMLDMYYN